MRGVAAILAIALLGIIGTFTTILIPSIIFSSFNYGISGEDGQYYNYNRGELAILALVSSKYNSTHTYYRILAENDVNAQLKLNQQVGFITKEFSIKGVFPTISLFVPYNKDSLVRQFVMVGE